MTAMMTGMKTDAGNISWLPGDPEDGAIETIAGKLRRQQGYAVGVVSTVPFNHATPACVLAHNVSRLNLSADAPGDSVDWDNTLLIVTADHATGYLRFDRAKRLGKGDLPAQVSDGGGFAYPGGEISFGTGGHTDELVRIYARGAGADRFSEYEGRQYPGTRIIDNTDLFRVIRDFTGAE